MIYRFEGPNDAQWVLEAHPKSLIGQRIAQSGRPYEWPMLDHIYDRFGRLDPDDVVVDVGGHIGNHTLYFACMLGAQVHTFEPLFFKDLKSNVLRNGLTDRITVHPYGLGEAVGTASDIGERVMEPGADRHKKGAGQGKLYPGEGDIEIRPLDELELERVKLIKIDIEGMEPQALRGAADTIERCHPALYIEAATKSDSRTLAAILEPWGYSRGERFVRGTPREEWLLS